MTSAMNDPRPDEMPATGHLTWTQIDRAGPPPKRLVRAEGARLYYDDGSSAIDASGGPVCVGIGHGRREVSEAVAAQMEKVSYGFDSEITERYAARLAAFTPGDLNRLYPCSGGSEAVEAAIRFARHYHYSVGARGKHKIISRWTSYHGNTLGAASASGGIPRRINFDPMLVRWPKIEPCYCYRCPFGLEFPDCGLLCAEKLEETIRREGPDSVAAFIAEPVVGATAGVLIPPPGYFARIREICDRYNVLFIADEVMTGFGRTGRNFAMEHWDVTPDVMTLGKGITSGYIPMGGIVVREKLMAPATPEVTGFGNIHTFSYHPVAAAAALAVLDILESENLVARSRIMGEKLMALLAPLQELRHVGSVRGLGLFAGVELVRDKKTRHPFDETIRAAQKVLFHCRQNGVALYSGGGMADGTRGDHLMIAPPFCVSDEELAQIVRVLADAIRALESSISPVN